MSKNRRVLCVIGAEVNNIEQRRLLGGIVAEARKKNCGVVVLSNLYNRYKPDRTNSADNKIYELIADIKVDAFIMLSESFVDPALRSKIRELLDKRSDVPAIIVGTSLPEFDAELFPRINTSDEKDIEAIVDRLVEENGFTRVALLTGPLSLEVSRSRVEGFRKSLEKHGLSYDESLVCEGDFWYYSGEKLAERYISGELPCPQALVCANDYMAFGVLDAFAAADIDVTERTAVVGYEYIPERSLHKPLLATYQRNRSALGAAAVDILVSRLDGETPPPFEPPAGVFIPGQSCPSADRSGDKLQEELVFLRTQNQYAGWNLKSDMESRLTECKNYDEFVSAMGEELFIVRYASDIVLCLFENWFRENEERGDTLICRNINKYARRGDIALKVSELHTLADYFPDAAVFYFNPVFFKERLLGYCAVMYDKPDAYDDTYRHWLKSVSNGLEFLRLKTDVNFLLQCSALSSSYDGATGLFNAEGMRTAFQLMKNSDKPANFTAVAFRLICDKDVFASEATSKETVGNLIDAAKAMNRFCGNNGVAGRISEFELVLIYPTAALSAELLADAVYSEILFSGANSGEFLYCGRSYDAPDIGFNAIAEDIGARLNELRNELNARRSYPYYKEIEKIRGEITRRPTRKYSLDDISDSLHLNPNYFNRLYKRIYSTSFGQDQIRSRIRFAKRLLASTDLSVSEIAEKCDYSDGKYFIRQFTASAGLSPKQYRNAIKAFFE